MNYYSHHIGDYRGATTHLTNDEDLAYRRLLEMYYDTERPIPADIQWVSRRLRIGCEHIATVLQDFFILEDDGYHNPRCDEEIAKYAIKAETARANGKNGGRSKSLKPLPKNPVGTYQQPTANPDITQPLANQEPITNNQEPIITPLTPQGGVAVVKPTFKLFDQFWLAYPRQRRGSRDKAKAAYQKAVQRGFAEQEIISGAEAYAASSEVLRGYAKGAEAWLNDDRFTNDYSESPNGKTIGRGGAAPTKTDRLNAAVERAIANSSDFSRWGWQGEPGADARPMLPRHELVWEGAGTDRSRDSPASDGVVGLFD